MAALVKYKVPREAALVKWKHLSSTKVCLRAGNAEEMQRSLRKGREGSFEEKAGNAGNAAFPEIIWQGTLHFKCREGRVFLSREAKKKKIGSGENIFCVFLFGALGKVNKHRLMTAIGTRDILVKFCTGE